MLVLGLVSYKKDNIRSDHTDGVIAVIAEWIKQLEAIVREGHDIFQVLH